MYVQYTTLFPTRLSIPLSLIFNKFYTLRHRVHIVSKSFYLISYCLYIDKLLFINKKSRRCGIFILCFGFYSDFYISVISHAPVLMRHP